MEKFLDGIVVSVAERPNSNKSLDFEAESRQLFDDCAPAYPDMDPYWGDFDELRLAFDLDNTLLKNLKSGAVLDAGCGPGLHLQAFVAAWYSLVHNGSLRVCGIDFSSIMLRRATHALHSELQPVTVDLHEQNLVTDQPKITGSFDCILCVNNTLGNLVGPDLSHTALVRSRVLRQFRKLLRPGGRLVLSVFNRQMMPTPAFDRSSYSPDRCIDSALSSPQKGDLVLWRACRDGRSHCCVSHWFTHTELHEATSKAGFGRPTIISKGRRILASCRAAR